MINNNTIKSIMRLSPQQWTVDSILSKQYGHVILADDERACLNSTQFYYIEGPFLLSFAQSLRDKIKFPSIITSSNQEWYRYFESENLNDFQLLPRRMYIWTNQVDKLRYFVEKRSEYSVKQMGMCEAEQMQQLEWAEGVFDSYLDVNDFLKRGFGYCVLDRNKIISLCISFAESSHGVEIEVDTDPEYQGLGIGKMVSAHFVAEAHRRGLVSLWDATNIASAKIADALGFEFVREYTALCSIE